MITLIDEERIIAEETHSIMESVATIMSIKKSFLLGLPERDSLAFAIGGSLLIQLLKISPYSLEPLDYFTEISKSLETFFADDVNREKVADILVLNQSRVLEKMTGSLV